MDLNKILSEKKERAAIVKKEYGLLQKHKPLGLIKVTDKNLIKELRDGLITLPSGFVVEVEGAEKEKIGKNIIAISNIDEKDLIAFDFIICDNEIESLNKYFEKGIAPIIHKENTLSSILKDFNPVKSEGNSIFVEDLNKWAIFYGIVKYLENYKFPFDNKNLVKNILSV